LLSLEKNGPILFVKPFPTLDALEIDCNLNAQETYVLKKICPDYSVTCVNKEGKYSRKHISLFKDEVKLFNKVVIMGKQCCSLLKIPYFEWAIRSKEKTILITPPIGIMMNSGRRLKKLREMLEGLNENV
jgi:hypothetical protein